jgi:hypothetical protein
MLCDRCVLNVKCEFFAPGGACEVEKRAYDQVVSELMGQYALDGLADEILVGRVAMYLIRIARAEVYEANVGVSDASVAWGKYISGLDSTLRTLLKELALTRAERKKPGKGDVLVDVDQLLTRVTKVTHVTQKANAFRMRSAGTILLKDWVVDKRKLGQTVRRDNAAGSEDSEKSR